MSYCIYLRKSRADMEAESRGEGETLARHEKILIELASKLRLNVTKIHKEVVSGETISSRPVMQQLLNEVEQGIWKGVLVVEVERLARGDTIDQGIVAQAFKYSDTKIITPTKTYDPSNEFDEEYFEFGLFMSRREYKTINRRLQQGRLQSVKEGKYLGNTPPYGYLRKKLEKQKGYTLEINPEQAPVVKMIFDLYTRENRKGVGLIVRKLNEIKAPTMRGGVWVNATIQDILRNPVYTGKIRWNARPTIKKVINGEIIKERPRASEEDVIIVDGLHDPIIDENTFNKAQYYLSLNSTPKVTSSNVIKNPLVGLIVCGMCERKMVRRPHNLNKRPDTLMCPITACDNVSSQLNLVEDKLLKSIKEWLDKYKLDIEEQENVNKNNYQIDIMNKSIDKLDKELKTLNRQLDNMHDLLEQGIYTTETFLNRSKVISNKISTTEKNKKDLIDQIAKEEIKEKSKNVLIPKMEHLLEVYGGLTEPRDKNILLKEVLEKAVYTKTVNGRWDNANLDNFELELHPKLPT